MIFVHIKKPGEAKYVTRIEKAVGFRLGDGKIIWVDEHGNPLGDMDEKHVVLIEGVQVGYR